MFHVHQQRVRIEYVLVASLTFDMSNKTNSTGIMLLGWVVQAMLGWQVKERIHALSSVLQLPPKWTVDGNWTWERNQLSGDTRLDR